MNIPSLIKKGEMSLDNWLELMLSNKREEFFPNNSFPTDEYLNQYINRIEKFSDKNFKNLLRRLVVNTGSYGIDEDRAQSFMLQRGKKEYPNEYYRRLYETGDAYEGLTWVLDLLPYSPKIALEAINAYSLAHFMTLPDLAMNGLYDAQVLIRARYLQNDYSVETLLELSPREFECLVAKLYKKLGYEVELTQSTRDGGKDVIAENATIARKEKLYIECKRYKKNVGVNWARALFGTVTDAKVTKGVLIGARGFSKGSIEFANQNSSIELIGGKDLLNLLDENLGKNWFDFIPKYIKEFS